MERYAQVDCDAGRRLGCRSFCCTLLVRLDAAERGVPGEGAERAFVDKSADGWCVHFDRRSGLCRIWERRPRVCREYDCNGDFLLQVVLREGFESMANLVRRAAQAYIPSECFVRIPLRGHRSGGVSGAGTAGPVEPG